MTQEQETSMKIGVIGNWGHHGAVLDETDRMPEASAVGIAPGFDAEDLTSLETRYAGTATRYADHRTMLSEKRPDVVIISTRLDRIAGLAADAAHAGCHTICEKPLAVTHEDLARLWRAITSCRTQCIAMLPNRNQPVLAAARRAVESGRIGEVKLLNARKSYKFSGPRSGWIARRVSYGGTLPWIGIHALDFIDSIIPVPITSLSAMHGNVAHPEDPECEDVCTMNLRLEGGALATVSVDYLRPGSANSHGDDWLRIVGTEGSIEAAMERNQCTVIDRDGHGEIADFSERLPYYAPIIRGFPAPGSAGPAEATARSFYLTHVALRARDAADTGTIVSDLTPPWGRDLGKFNRHTAACDASNHLPRRIHE
jgi:predicted dehydrogenase